MTNKNIFNSPIKEDGLKFTSEARKSAYQRLMAKRLGNLPKDEDLRFNDLNKKYGYIRDAIQVCTYLDTEKDGFMHLILSGWLEKGN